MPIEPIPKFIPSETPSMDNFNRRIDAANDAIEEIQTEIEGKQDALTGSAGQVVGFDAEGHAVAQEPPRSGLTQAEADGRYLALSGGTVTGDTTLSTGDGTQIQVAGGAFGTIDLYACNESRGTGARIILGAGSNAASSGIQLRLFGADEVPSLAILPSGIRARNFPAPSGDDALVTKGYVDAAISGALEEAY